MVGLVVKVVNADVRELNVDALFQKTYHHLRVSSASYHLQFVEKNMSSNFVAYSLTLQAVLVP